MTLMGVDGCTGGWIAAVDAGQDHAPRCERFASIEVLMKREPSIVAVDVPIGLLERGARVCDTQARQLLAPRRSSVFPAPIRATLTAASHDEASALRFEVEGKKISIQSWGIIRKVAEVDEGLRAHAAWRLRIFEVHPEVCFYYLNDQRPMAHPKKRADGVRERLDLLRPHFGRAVDDALAARGTLGCGVDDVIDAFVSLWTARRIASGCAVRIPIAPLADPLGIPMEMVA